MVKKLLLAFCSLLFSAVVLLFGFGIYGMVNAASPEKSDKEYLKEQVAKAQAQRDSQPETSAYGVVSEEVQVTTREGTASVCILRLHTGERMALVMRGQSVAIVQIR